jgi:hypothetical protein
VFAEFIETVAGQKIESIVEEAVIQHVTKSPIAVQVFEAFCDRYIARRMKDEQSRNEKEIGR